MAEFYKQELEEDEFSIHFPITNYYIHVYGYILTHDQYHQTNFAIKRNPYFLWLKHTRTNKDTYIYESEAKKSEGLIWNDAIQYH